MAHNSVGMKINVLSNEGMKGEFPVCPQNVFKFHACVHPQTHKEKNMIRFVMSLVHCRSQFFLFSNIQFVFGLLRTVRVRYYENGLGLS